MEPSRLSLSSRRGAGGDDAWFVKTDAPNGLKLNNRRALALEKDGDFGSRPLCVSDDRRGMGRMGVQQMSQFWTFVGVLNAALAALAFVGAMASRKPQIIVFGFFACVFLALNAWGLIQ